MKSQKNKKAKLHIKIGDSVKIIAGDYKGQIGQVIQTFASKHQVVIKDINMKTKHMRPLQEGQSGQIIRKEAPIDSSNVMLYDGERKIASRYRKSTTQSGQDQRILIKTN
uniref:Large ribosomal subunit protein uL24c n=1 Tax=Titanophycus setchellii TaxID=940129 RepID=A0A1G4NYE6_9FLOR|nr:Ribosomal protein L24 [Titanophycus setchellii]SCW23644.1 Ribosomal protein L24 [Titanophycus setchellii]